MSEPEGKDTILYEAREYASWLLFSIDRFRKGEDRAGLDYFSDCIPKLGKLLEEPEFTGRYGMGYREILPELRALLLCMRNEDITGLTDLLEFKFYPAAQAFMEGWDEL